MPGRNFYFERATHELSYAVAQGNPFAQAEHTNRLPPSVIRAMVSGEDQAPSIPLLRELSTIYSERSRSRKDFMIEGLPAVGVVILGLIIGFVVVSLFMPMISMVTALS